MTSEPVWQDDPPFAVGEQKEGGVMSVAHQEKTCPWQPIETAPKDGTDVLTWTPPENHIPGIICGIHCGFYEPTMKVWIQSDLEWELNPSHWMPLQDPPKPPKQDGERV